MSASARRQGGTPYKIGDQAHRAAMEKKHNIFRMNPVRMSLNIYAGLFVVPAFAFCAFLGPENCKSLGLPWNHVNPVRGMMCDGEPNNSGMGFWSLLVQYPAAFMNAIMMSARYGTTTVDGETYFNFGISDCYGEKTGPIKVDEDVNGLGLAVGKVWGPLLAVPALLLAIRRYKPNRNNYTFLRSGAYRMPDAAQMPYAVAGTVIRTWFYWEVLNFFLITKPFEWVEQGVRDSNEDSTLVLNARDVNAHFAAPEAVSE